MPIVTTIITFPFIYIYIQLYLVRSIEFEYFVLQYKISKKKKFTFTLFVVIYSLQLNICITNTNIQLYKYYRPILLWYINIHYYPNIFPSVFLYHLIALLLMVAPFLFLTIQFVLQCCHKIIIMLLDLSLSSWTVLLYNKTRCSYSYIIINIITL